MNGCAILKSTNIPAVAIIIQPIINDFDAAAAWSVLCEHLVGKPFVGVTDRLFDGQVAGWYQSQDRYHFHQSCHLVAAVVDVDEVVPLPPVATWVDVAAA